MADLKMKLNIKNIERFHEICDKIKSNINELQESINLINEFDFGMKIKGDTVPNK